MPRHLVIADRRRHLLPLPREQREQQPFVIDARTGRVIAPWPPKRAQPGDEERMDAMLERLDAAALPGPVCWCWPDRDPEPVTNAAPDWLRAWARDRAVYPIAA